ncbi:hypothetical protein C2E21_3449 isoform A [Chlorella sorokiniana]|uniref:Hydroxyproline O-arabinosyltransferase-like domain-containing protein n=1 Tax=Chlorella sorokiniana TaxID=3076 RepID=A0A2P6TUI9_CHLSO|nr:hypothetical protein C2E21_3449 isoform A [Chlorella sorokiniana]|eukprot:PRW57732.1 hypothetical protein C2E21_3449 isoform A [Chlorella sorokiniana]
MGSTADHREAPPHAAVRRPPSRQELGSRLPWALTVVLAQLHSGAAGTAAASHGGGSWPTTGDTIHTILASNGGPYINYQTLALYGSWRRVRRMPGGEKMVAFTRILHRTAHDELSAFVPTVKVQPKHPECDGREAEPGRRWVTECKWPPANRINATAQFFQAVLADPSLVKAPYLYYIEPDFLLVKPVVAPGPAEGAAPALGFFYPNVFPEYPQWKDLITRKLFPPGLGPLSAVPRSGPAPVVMRVADWVRAAPRWVDIADQMETEPELVKGLDWVRDMYSFCIAMAVERIPLRLEGGMRSTLIVLPPAANGLGSATGLHYTYASRIRWAANASLAWQFEKRAWTRQRIMEEVPPVPLPPPWQPGLLIGPGDNKPPLSKEQHELFTLLAETFNRGLEEVGGKNFREVLGPGAEPAREIPAPAAAAAAAATSGVG